MVWKWIHRFASGYEVFSAVIAAGATVLGVGKVTSLVHPLIWAPIAAGLIAGGLTGFIRKIVGDRKAAQRLAVQERNAEDERRRTEEEALCREKRNQKKEAERRIRAHVDYVYEILRTMHARYYTNPPIPTLSLRDQINEVRIELKKRGVSVPNRCEDEQQSFKLWYNFLRDFRDEDYSSSART